MARKAKLSQSEVDQQTNQYWEEWWKPILVKKDGSIDVEQLKKELFDYRELTVKHCAFISEATGNKLSKPSYTLQSLLSAFYDHVEQERKYAAEDAVADYKAENGIDDDSTSSVEDESEGIRDTADVLNNPDLLDQDEQYREED